MRGMQAGEDAGTHIRCDRLVELVTDYLDGALDDGAVAEFEAHLALCSGCAEYVQQMRETSRTLGHLSRDGLPDDTRARLLAAFEEMPR